MSRVKALPMRLKSVDLYRLISDRDGDSLRRLFADVSIALELEQSPSRSQERVLDLLNLCGEGLANYFGEGRRDAFRDD